MKRFKRIIILGLFIPAFLVLLVTCTKTKDSTPDPDEYSQSSSRLVQENWDDNFISDIKLVINSDEVYINGVLTIFERRDLTPVVYNDSAFLPIGLIAGLLKATVTYDGDRNAIIEAGDTRVEIFAGRNTIAVNGEDKILEAPSYILNDEPMAHLGVMEFFGFDPPVWDVGSNEIVLTKAYQTYRLIVVANDGIELVETHGAVQVIEGPNNLYVLQYDSEEAAREADRLFNEDPDILFSQPDSVLHAEAPADAVSWGVGRIGADYFTEQLNVRSNKNEVIVAVLDTGIDSNHPFLRDRISDIKWNFIRGNNNPNDVDGHGTHVSGIIVDSTPSNVKIMPLKVLGDDGLGSSLNVHNAIFHAVDSGADVINMSLGSHMGVNARVPLYERAIDYAISKNVIVVVAAGNENGDVQHFSPAYYSKLITVSATDENDERASFSNFGDAIDIAAPGVSIKSSIPGGGFAEMSGTSMAAPFIAACAALLRTTDSSLSQDDVIALLAANADNIGLVRYFGAGIVNVANLAPKDDEPPIAEPPIAEPPVAEPPVAELPAPAIPVTDISLNQRNISLFIDNTEQLVAVVMPDNATNPDVLWKSDNPDVATVSQDGLVTAVNPGNTVITASTVDGGVWDNVLVAALVYDEPVDLRKNLLALASFIIILLLSSRVNLSKPKRSRQFILPLVALIYCVVVVICANKINEWIISAVAWLSHYVPFIAGINLTKWLIYIFNALIAAVFLMVKGMLLPLVNMVWSKPQFPFNQTSGKFYEYNERMNAWVLKDEFGQAKILWKGFFWFAVGISSVILLLSQIFPDWIFFRTPFYPVFGVLVMGEILFFLSGLTAQEMLSTIAGDDDEYYRIANYGILRRVFHDLFDERILFDNTADSLYGLTSFTMLDNLAESNNALDMAISKYFTDLKEKGHAIDPGFVRSSIEMVNGKSVLINTPFYRDLTGYIVLPLVRQLLNYEKALIIVGRDSVAGDLRDWMHNGIASFCGTPDLWKTAILTDQKTECDVGILRFADVYNQPVLNANAEFLNQVGFVLLIEPSRIVSTGQIGLSLIVDQLGKNGEKNIVYCSCDRNCDGLVDTLSHVFKVNLTEIYATVPTLANCSLMYWNAHGDFLHHKIIPNIAHYLGVGTELSAVALRHQIATTVWVSSERFPVLDMRWIAGQYYNQICAYIGYPQSQEAFAEAFRAEANLWNLGVRDNAYLTVEDEFNNLFEMTRLYSTRAKNQGFVNIISENYLLRGYMVDNASIFAADSKVIPSIVPDYTRTERNTVVALIMAMSDGEVSERDLQHKLSLAGIKCADAHDEFCELVKRHCHVESVDLAKVYKDEIVGDDMRMATSTFYTIPNNNTEFANYAHAFKNAYFIIEDDKDENYFLGAMLYGQVFQRYLPGQMLTYSGKYYQVHTIIAERGVVLRRAADHITDRKSYRQRREYTLSGFSPDPAMGSFRTSRGVAIRRGLSNISVKTRGYYELSSLDNIASAHEVDLENIPDRAYKNKAVLCLKLAGVSGDVRFAVAMLLNEIFATLYPESCHYITATVKMQSDTTSNILKLLSPLQLDDSADPEAIYIIEDCEIDLGLLVSVERNLTRLLEIIADYLAWHETKFAETDLSEHDENETDAGTDGASADEAGAPVDEAGAPADESSSPVDVAQPVPIQKHSDDHYLLYGYEQLDPLLNIQGALQFLTLHGYDKNALEQARLNSDVAAGIKAENDYFGRPDAHFCDFCAVELSGGEYDVLADGRERCTQCANSAMKTVEQFTRLYESALRNMETFFGIRINVAIKVRMADAKKIAKMCGERFIPTPGFDGRVLAFAKKDSDGYTIYVENGAPKIAAVANMVHELTHIWQYINWNRMKIRSHYGKENELLVYEGMAKWTEIQYLFFLNEVSYAKRQEIYTRGRFDVYGRGFVKYADQYPLVYGPGYRKASPFNREWPLEMPID
jgi:subtilisin family serine protease